MCFHSNTFIFLFSLIFFKAQVTYGQVTAGKDSVSIVLPPDSLLKAPRDPLKSSAIVFGLNLGIWGYDRFITRSPFAKIDFNTILQNFRTGFTGDNDGFMTNLLSHPYNGGLYYCAPRSNGLNFWQSVPYIAKGSFMWEMFMENEPAAINDILTSTIGGAGIGEISYRISDRVIDDRTVGVERFGRETLLALISPIRELNRLISGQAWKHRNFKGRSVPDIPACYYSSLGYRFITDASQKNFDPSRMFIYEVGMLYGDPHDPENEKPYDFFTINMMGNISSSQSLLSQVKVLGSLCSANIELGKRNSLILGIYQHINYFQLSGDISNHSLHPYKISEAASAGPGILYKRILPGNTIFSGSAYLSGILVGGYQNDHTLPGIRTYEMGSGFSPKLYLGLQFGNKTSLTLNIENYRFWSWIGNLPPKTVSFSTHVKTEDGYANLSVIGLNLNYPITRHVFLSVKTGFYFRKNWYTDYPTVSHSFIENTFSAGYVF